MNNLNSVDQLLMRALLGQQFKPKHLNAKTAVIGPVVQTVGTGLADLTSGGVFTDTVDHVYTIKIHTDGGHFQFKTDSGAFGGDVAITGSAQTLANGVTVTFGGTSGYTVGDTFTITVKAGVAIATATALGNITVNSVGNGAELKIFDGADSSGTLLYDSLTANWTAGNQYPLGYALQNAAGLYVVLYAATTYPDLIVGYN